MFKRKKNTKNNTNNKIKNKYKMKFIDRECLDILKIKIKNKINNNNKISKQNNQTHQQRVP
jgi:hypothetical protein